MQQTRKIYVAGFLFDYPVSSVVLIRKTHPDWQAGLLNGVGGKVTGGETPLVAMQREFNEEAGCWVDKWEKFLILTDGDSDIHFFKAYATTKEQRQVMTMTEETITVITLTELFKGWLLPRENWVTIANLQYIIPMALDAGIRQSSIYLL